MHYGLERCNSTFQSQLFDLSAQVILTNMPLEASGIDISSRSV
jgi:hypothetical protein